VSCTSYCNCNTILLLTCCNYKGYNSWYFINNTLSVVYNDHLYKNFNSLIPLHVQNATIPCRSHELLLLLRYVPFHATLLHHLFYHAISPHLATYFLVYLSFFLFPNSYITHFWEFYFLPFCTCPNQHNLSNLNVSIIVGFLTLAKISLLVNILQFSFPLSYTGP
jgi:hypothetical protein